MAAATAAALAACSSSDDSSPSGGGSGGSGGNAAAGSGHSGSGGASAGSGGKASGGSGGAAAGTGGASAGSGGSAAAGSGGLGNTSGAAGAGEGGAAGGGGDAGSANPCGPGLTRPTVASTIAVTDSAVLVAAYAAVGTQTYTCGVTGTGDTAVYAWSAASVPAATLYGSDCMIAATHYAGPHWKANDGSIIAGTKVRNVASATAASIPQLLLSAMIDGGTTGIFTPVTAVQRLNTVGGIAPATGCDAGHVAGTVAVPYTATYYFYSGADTIPPA